MDMALGGFRSMDYTNYTPPPAPPPPQVTTIGPCTVTAYPIVLGAQSATPIPTTNLDAGPALNLNGPNGIVQLAKVGLGTYSARPPLPGSPMGAGLVLDPGTYTIDNGSGGADVGPFMVTLTIPSFSWTNADANLTIDRSAAIDIQWTGGDPSGSVAIIGAAASMTDPMTFLPTAGASFSCLVPNTGDFMVTSDVLALLPAASGSLSILTTTLTTFTASGIDSGGVIYSAGAGRSVVFQ
jgi:hypothetical protein